jgi:ankyrin repeat protein
MQRIQDLPIEILLMIAGHFDLEQDINSLAQTSCQFYGVLDPFLYRHNAIQHRMSALVWAAKQGFPQTARRSLDAGSKVPNRVSLCHGALGFAIEEGHTAVANILLAQEGVDPNFRHRRIPFLVIAAIEGHADMVELLLATKGVNPDIEVEECMYGFGWTALSFSATQGFAGVVELLLRNPGVNVEHRIREDGKRALHLAVCNGHEDAVRRLLAVGADHEARDDEGNTPLFYAASSGWLSIVKLLLETGAEPYASLIEAVFRGNTEIVQLMLETESVDPNARGDEQRTALSEAAVWGRVTIARLLIRSGRVNPDSKDDEGRTPLSYAAEYGRLEIVEMLLSHPDGVDLEAKDLEGRTPLSYALERGHHEEVELLTSAKETTY